MKVMVLGATGFIGPAVIARLAAHGHQALSVSRGEWPRSLAADVVHLQVDRTDAEALGAALERWRPAAVIDLLAYTLAGTAPVLAAVADCGARYVMASSADVYRQYDFLHRRDSGRAADRLDEAAPLRTRLFPYRAQPRRRPDDPQAWMDDYDKIPIERALVAGADLSWSLVRLPMVFGPGDRQRRFGWAVGPMLKQARTLAVDAQWAAWRSSYGYVDDVAEALVLAAVHPAAAGRVFNAGPPETVTHAEWIAALAEVAGWRGEIRPLARDRLAEPLRATLEALDLRYPLSLDTRLIRQALGYAEVTAAEDALRRTLADEDGRGAA